MPLRRRKQTRKTRKRTLRVRRAQRGGSAAAPTWLILQYDNRQVSSEFQMLIGMNRKYANRHGYQYRFISEQYPMPPYWIKVKLTKDFLDEQLPNGRQKYRGVMFIDTDAVIVKPQKSLDQIIAHYKDFVAASDTNYPDFPSQQSKFNAGVFIVRNTPETRKLFDDWMNVYEGVKRFWTFNGSTWHTNGNWAGAYYEQGSFVDQILPKHPQTIQLLIKDRHILQAEYNVTPRPEPIKPDTFVIHFSHIRKNIQLPVFLSKEFQNLQQLGGGNQLPASQDFPDSPVCLVTSSNVWKPTLEALIRSCIRNRLSYRVMGIGEPWNGFITKMENYKKAAKDLQAQKGGNSLLIFVDAYDCLVIQPAQRLVELYNAKPRRMPILSNVALIFVTQKHYPGLISIYDQECQRRF
jgi:hypothetical protein